MKQHDLTQAISLADRALRKDPRVREHGLACRAEAYAADGQLDLALLDLAALRKQTGSSQRGLLECASMYHRFGKWAEAIECFDLAEERGGSNPMVYFHRGAAYAEMGSVGLAAVDYSRYIERVPMNSEVWTARADANRRLGKPKRALKDYEQAIKLNEVSLEALSGICQANFDLHRFQHALDASEKAQRLDSLAPSILLCRGRIYHAQKRSSQAVAEFDKALEFERDPRKRADIYLCRGEVAFESGGFEAAEADFRQAMECNPYLADAYVWRASANARLEKWPAVVEDLETAKTVRPALPKEVLKRARSLAREAVAVFGDAIELGEVSAEVHFHRSLAYYFLGKLDEAKQDLESCLQQRQDARWVTRLARICCDQGHADIACRDLSLLLKQTPENDQALYLRARSWIKEKKFDKAMADIKQALQYNETTRYHQLHGDLALLTNEIDLAIECYTRVLNLDSSDYQVLRKRGAVYLQNRMPQRAIADLTRSLEVRPEHGKSLQLRGRAYLENRRPNLAKLDFEKSIKYSGKQVAAYTGRAQSLAQMEEYEHALIWVTKSLHHFDASRDIAELLLVRGKIFYQMGRLAPALTDFTAVLNLQREHPRRAASARCARAIVLVQNGDLLKAKKEFDRVLKRFPDHSLAKPAASWLSQGEGPRPKILAPPEKSIRPSRPPVLFFEVVLEAQSDQLASKSYELWVVRYSQKREYGPLSKSVLDEWVKQGRVGENARLLKSGWTKWKRAGRLYKGLKHARRRPKPDAKR